MEINDNMNRFTGSTEVAAILRVEFALREAADREGDLGVAGVWFVPKGRGLSGALESVDEGCGGALGRALRASRFEGEREDVLEDRKSVV